MPVYDKEGRIIARTRIDPRDHEKMMVHRWNLSPDGYVVRHVTRAGGKKKTIRLHRVVNRTPEGMLTDHVNGNKLDNRRQNLRSATPSQNNANSRPRPRRSRYRGVYWHNQAGKWVSQISVNGTVRHLGLFRSEDRAGRAYDEVAQIEYGEFARLNFPGQANRTCGQPTAQESVPA